MWSADKYLNALYQETTKAHSEIYDKNWQDDLKDKFKRALGDFQFTNGNLHPTLLEKVDMDTYYRLRVEIRTDSLLKMPVYLLIPKGSHEIKYPAVIALHGHGYGSKEAVGLNPDGSKLKEKGYHQNFAIELVKKGVIVAVPELIGFGDRKLQKDQGVGSPTDNSCYMMASQLLLNGKTLAGLRVAECRRVIDYVQSLDEVDNDRIGCMGISGGGLVAAFTSALDDRIKAVVVSGYANTFEGSIMARRHCLDNYIPGILKYAEMPDLIGLIAPRALFIEAGMEDHLFPLEKTLEAIEQLTKIYRSFGVEDLLSYHLFKGGHEISGEKSFDWLIQKLNEEIHHYQ
ncbi:dienelactone hydrolase family protein [Sporosarcina ureilytica]|uniref:Dienelactone hydrolase n=1 Tax=Sporosarcina ureilytica TaxID=298596 RepID=A0A1D8JIS0_9BACL|nr:alpha/beta hydrolase family protein [Sporosarcina ureilytica]AOV08608.1 hypothetical protein BI350_14405 [Sporosarcina ureilytica]